MHTSWVQYLWEETSEAYSLAMLLTWCSNCSAASQWWKLFCPPDVIAVRLKSAWWLVYQTRTPMRVLSTFFKHRSVVMTFEFLQSCPQVASFLANVCAFTVFIRNPGDKIAFISIILGAFEDWFTTRMSTWLQNLVESLPGVLYAWNRKTTIFSGISVGIEEYCVSLSRHLFIFLSREPCHLRILYFVYPFNSVRFFGAQSCNPHTCESIFAALLQWKFENLFYSFFLQRGIIYANVSPWKWFAWIKCTKECWF